MKKLLITLALVLFPVSAFAQYTVYQGGTGQTNFPLNTFIYAQSALRLAATTSPTVGYITATTTATSTFAGGIAAARVCLTGSPNICLGGSSGGAGTVTSITFNNGLTSVANPITTSGTAGLDLTRLVSGALTIWNGSQLQATGTPQLTVGNLLATSTATSTFVGGIDAARVCITGTTKCLNNITNGTVTSVDVSGASTGLTFTGGPVTTSGTITLGGTLGIANGGTNNTSFPMNSLVYFNGSAIRATSTQPLTVGSILATTTATSTYVGGISAARVCLSGSPTTCLAASGGGSSGLSIIEHAASSSITYNNFITFSTTTSITAGQVLQITAVCSSQSTGSGGSFATGLVADNPNNQGSTTIATAYSVFANSAGSRQIMTFTGQYTATTTGLLRLSVNTTPDMSANPIVWNQYDCGNPSITWLRFAN